MDKTNEPETAETIADYRRAADSVIEQVTLGGEKPERIDLARLVLHTFKQVYPLIGECHRTSLSAGAYRIKAEKKRSPVINNPFLFRSILIGR